MAIKQSGNCSGNIASSGGNSTFMLGFAGKIQLFTNSRSNGITYIGHFIHFSGYPFSVVKFL